jgi:hypothetical protein
MGVLGEESEHLLVAQLDLMLNSWIDTVPPHRELLVPKCVALQFLTLVFSALG